MISRSRAIVKDLKVMKNLGWLTNRENWFILARHHLPETLMPYLERLRLWPLEKMLVKRYRWVKLTKNHAEMMVPQNLFTQNEEKRVSISSLLEASTIMIRELIHYSWPYPQTLQLNFVDVQLNEASTTVQMTVQTTVQAASGAIRLIGGWTDQECEDLYFNLRQTSRGEVLFQIGGYNKDEQLMAQLQCRVSAEVLTPLLLPLKNKKV